MSVPDDRRNSGGYKSYDSMNTPSPPRGSPPTGNQSIRRILNTPSPHPAHPNMRTPPPRLPQWSPPPVRGNSVRGILNTPSPPPGWPKPLSHDQPRVPQPRVPQPRTQPRAQQGELDVPPSDARLKEPLQAHVVPQPQIML